MTSAISSLQTAGGLQVLQPRMPEITEQLFH